ncbi:MAG: thioredoxin domain-containing protein, partial [Deltaproteobacteria bacterium]|nr:thioredoxin domain-containing protein [Deltaproteobacteria bacterium]
MKFNFKKSTPWIVMSILVLTGIFFSVYLTLLHYKVFMQTGYAADSSVCSISDRVNCETVAENPYSVFMGVPVSVWGIVGYLFIAMGALTGIFNPKSKLVYLYNLALVGIACLVSITLGYISITKISSICIFCFGIYFINFILLGFLLTFIIKSRTNIFKQIIPFLVWSKNHLYYSIPFVLGGLALVGSLFIFYPKYWETKVVNSKDLKRLASGTDKFGHPWIGARTPLVTIHEYSDYECPFCSRYHFKVREFVGKYPEKIRLVHHNYPLDHHCNSIVTKPFHLSSCQKAKLAICAQKNGVFWKVNDFLFNNKNKRVTPYILSNKLDLDSKKLQQCVEDPKTDATLQKEIKAGQKMKLNATPTFFVNGKRMRNFNQVIDLMKKRSGKDDKGNNWIGAASPEITIHEYTDYECPSCSKFHRKLRTYISHYPDQLRLVHHHYPLDQSCNSLLTKPFHKKACGYSLMAICADKQNKFWETNDYIFRNVKTRQINSKTLSEALSLDKKTFDKCLKDPATRKELLENVSQGIEKQINSTPSFY